MWNLPDAIICGMPSSNTCESSRKQQDNANSKPRVNNSHPNFSAERIALFEQRFDEGYNIPDLEYEK